MSALKIKDAQGNWIEVPMIKGDKGDKGEQGDTYELTEQDKQDIADLVEVPEPLKYVKDDSSDNGGVIEGDVDNNIASGMFGHAEGDLTVASGRYSHAEGYHTTASGYDSHSEGSSTVASGDESHAEGYHTTASEGDTHAEGYFTTASGLHAHAEGMYSVASGYTSHAEGSSTSNGYMSHTEGEGTVSTRRTQSVSGSFNIVDTAGSNENYKGAYATIVGNGTDANHRSNAYTLDWNGNGVYSGKVTVGTAPTNDMDVATKKYVDDVKGASIHICSSAEYDSTTRVPTIQTPDERTFYLVPSADGTSPDLFVEWAYVNNAWEMFGSASIDLSNYVTNTDYATSSTGGIVKIGTGIKVGGDGERIYTDPANGTQIKTGTDAYRPLTPFWQSYSTFYGLAKASGDSTQSASSNTVGTYTDEAKASIKNMLGVQDNMVVTVERNETSDWQADKTYTEIHTALIKGINVIVDDYTYLLPYVGQLYQNNIMWFAFGVSTVFNNINTLFGYLIGYNNEQTIVAQINQNTPIPQINDLTTGSDTVWSSSKIKDELDYKVSDVQINGTSILSDGVANVPVASTNELGAVKVNTTYGTTILNNAICISRANDALIKDGTNQTKPITPVGQHCAVFYGLAKSAGDTTQSQSSNAVGQYTESAKSSIHDMLNGSVSVSGTTPTIVAKSGIRYVCGEVASLDFTPCATGICDVIFTSGTTPTVLVVPSTIKWANGFDPTSLDANTTYELNIMDGLGVCGAWT